MKKASIILITALIGLTLVSGTIMAQKPEYKIHFNHNNEKPYSGYLVTTVEISLDQGQAENESQHLAKARQAAIDTLQNKAMKILSMTKRDFLQMGYNEMAEKISKMMGISTMEISYRNNNLILKGKVYFFAS